MNGKAKVFSVIIAVILAIITFLSNAKVTFATSLNWYKSSGITEYSQEIRVAPSDSRIVYATLRTATGSGLFKSTDQAMTFSTVLPVIGGRDINSIAISNVNPDKLWVGTYQVGVFKSTNGGATWQNSGLDNVRVRFLTIDPVNDNVLYAGTGENNSDGGVYKSSNSGGSWSLIGSNTYGRKNNLNLYVDWSNANRVFAGSDYGLYISNDAGTNWTNHSIGNTNYPATLVSNISSSTIFASVVGSGIKKSTDNGSTWAVKNGGMGSSSLFRLAQTSDGKLFASRRSEATGNGGGVWKSNNQAETWENIADPLWGNRDTWGIDVAGDRVIVSVSGLGVYYADSNTPPAPVVVVPGFGGSWSYKGLVENQATTYADWQLMPIFTDAIYQPLIATITNAGVTPTVFAYDFRKSIVDNANTLKTYLTDKVPGGKANIVAHSMGGLVTRYCYEKISGCSDKIEKIITAGSPHQGTLAAYPLWEAGDFGDMDILTKAAIEIALHAGSFPYLTDKDIVRNRLPGVRDLLPLSGSPTNTVLQSLSWTVGGILTSLSGKDFSTKSSFTTTSRSVLDQALGLWADGKPGSYSTQDGDGTILKVSSELSTNKKYYSLQHNDYFKNTTSLTDILTTFGLTPGAVVTTATNPTSVLAFIIRSPVTVSVNGNTGIDGKAVFIINPASGIYPITLTGTGNGKYELDSFYIDGTNSYKRTVSGTITTGATRTINFEFSPDPGQGFSETGDISLSSFRQKVADTNLRSLRALEATVVTAVSDIQTNRNRSGAFGKLESSYLGIWKLLMAENNGTNRRNLHETADQLVAVMDKLNTQYRSNPSASTATAEITRNQTTVTRKAAKSSLSAREAANVVLAQKLMADAAALKNASKNYQSLLLARAAGALSN